VDIIHGDAMSGDPPPKGIFAYDQSYYPEKTWITPPLLPTKSSVGKVVGWISIDGVTYPVPADVLAACGGNLAALIAALKALGRTESATRDVADAFFLAFVEHSDRTPVTAPSRFELMGLCAIHFGDTATPPIPDYRIPASWPSDLDPVDFTKA
jgi:hypothetical protein